MGNIHREAKDVTLQAVLNKVNDSVPIPKKFVAYVTQLLESKTEWGLSSEHLSTTETTTQTMFVKVP